MNLAHIHLLLNHFPTIGFGIGLLLFLAALFARSEELKRASFVILFLMAVIAIPAYMSGSAAESTLCPERTCPPEVSEHSIRAHEDAALLAFSFMEITGFVAWVGLWQLRRIPRLAAWNIASVLVLSLVTFGLMSNAATHGGEIRHPEIRASNPEAPVGEGEDGAIEGAEGIVRSIGAVVSGATGNSWLWPAMETLHFIGLCLLFTVVLLVNLRILGMAKKASFGAFYQLLPLGMMGFGLNLVTGMSFFIGAPGQYVNNPVYYWKIVLIVLGGVNILYFTLFDEAWAIGPGEDAPLRTKAAAATALLVWFGVLYCGHMLPFLGNSF